MVGAIGGLLEAGRVKLYCVDSFDGESWSNDAIPLESTRAFAWLLNRKGIRCELDIWGYDTPHDWPSWRAQFAHHLPRFC